jgi:hypothetical protein
LGRIDESSIYHATGELTKLALFRTLVANRPPTLHDDTARGNETESIDYLHIRASWCSEEQLAHMIVATGKKILHIKSVSAFIVTEARLMGLGPYLTEEGDVIVKFDGLRAPFLLRPIRGTKDYELVGKCYLHGYMCGKNEFQGIKKRLSLV